MHGTERNRSFFTSFPFLHTVNQWRQKWRRDPNWCSTSLELQSQAPWHTFGNSRAAFECYRLHSVDRNLHREFRYGRGGCTQTTALELLSSVACFFDVQILTRHRSLLTVALFLPLIATKFLSACRFPKRSHFFAKCRQLIFCNCDGLQKG